MEYYRDNWAGAPKPEKKLRILVVGAGIAGLTAAIGSHVDVASLLQWS